ncbi:MAG TPA: PAS domain-containing protein [Noviherbaspirillum sp.]
MSQAAPPRAPSPFTLSEPFAAWLVLALCIIATILAWFGLSQSRQQDHQARFELEAAHTVVHIRNALASHERMLHQVAALFANASFSHAAWQRYVSSLDLGKNFPGIQEIGFTETSGIHGGIRTAAATDSDPRNCKAKVCIAFILPGTATANLPRELATEHLPATNYQVQIDTGGLRQAALLMYSPVWSASRKLLGYVHARIAVASFMNAALPQTNQQLRFKVFEGKGASPRSLVHDSSPNTSSDDIKFRKTAIITFHEQPWAVEFESISPSLTDTIRADLYILCGGLFLALSLFGIMHTATRNSIRRESELVESERLASAARFQAFVEQLGGMPYIGKLDSKGSHLYVSPKVENLLGFTPEQWCNDPELRIRQLHELDRADVLNAIASTLSTQKPFSIDYRITCNNGSVRWFHDEARVVTDANGKPLFLQGVILDITDRKQAQEELECSHKELKKLINTLDALREEEQKRLAQEMHDDLGQLLTAMKMDLSVLAQHLPRNDAKDAKLLKLLDNINDLVNAMVTSVRRIISDLPPKILDDAGLFDALVLLGKNFEKRYQIKCRVHLPDEVAPAFEQKTAASVYRMIQESLNNVAKHACATEVDIRVILTEKHAMLSIADNGKGFSAADLHKAGSFGLIGMRERVASLNGKIRIESADHAGATIYISIPLDAKLTCGAELSKPVSLVDSI